jgi:hypothetical protein
VLLCWPDGEGSSYGVLSDRALGGRGRLSRPPGASQARAHACPNGFCRQGRAEPVKVQIFCVLYETDFASVDSTPRAPRATPKWMQQWILQGVIHRVVHVHERWRRVTVAMKHDITRPHIHGRRPCPPGTVQRGQRQPLAHISQYFTLVTLSLLLHTLKLLSHRRSQLSPKVTPTFSNYCWLTAPFRYQVATIQIIELQCS